MDYSKSEEIHEILNEFYEEYEEFQFQYFGEVVSDSQYEKSGIRISEDERLMFRHQIDWHDLKKETGIYVSDYWIESNDGQKIRDIGETEARKIISHLHHDKIEMLFCGKSKQTLDRLAEYGHWTEEYVQYVKKHVDDFRIALNEMIQEAENDPEKRNEIYEDYLAGGQPYLDSTYVFLIYLATRNFRLLTAVSTWDLSHKDMNNDIRKAKDELDAFFYEEFRKADLPQIYKERFAALEEGNPYPLLEKDTIESKEK